MIYDPATDTTEDICIAYIGGGSRGWAWTLMTDLAMERGLSGVVRLYDLDEAAACDNAVIGRRLMEREDVRGHWDFEVSHTLKEALTGADFVVISILPGTLGEMAVDVHFPERIGIYQSVGDTTGPGGIIRALRTVPIFKHFAEAIRDYAPRAWVINYTNPMALAIRTLYHVFPGIRAFGCCHEVFNTEELLADICMKSFPSRHITRRDIDVDVLGINHFTWFSSASYRGIDLMELFREFALSHRETGCCTPGKNWEDSTFHSANRVKMDLFLRYGWIAAAGDRHLAEFMPGEMYLKDPGTVYKWMFWLTPVSWRIEDQARRRERAARLLSGGEEISLVPTGEEGLLLIRALVGQGRMVSNVNLPNSFHQIANLPADTVVETNAVFSRDHIHPVAAGALSGDVLSLMEPHVINQETVLDAALNHRRDAVYEAFMRDPLVAGRAGRDEIISLCDDMIAATARYLPDSWA